MAQNIILVPPATPKIGSARARGERAAVGDSRPRAAGGLTVRLVGVRKRARGLSGASREGQQREQTCSNDFHGAPPLGPLPPSNLRALGPGGCTAPFAGRARNANLRSRSSHSPVLRTAPRYQPRVGPQRGSQGPWGLASRAF